jgi:DNA-binding winged helix-turn-helix (wHTH) protein/tetratricopeptide (TPR) repeat protein
MSAVRYQFEPFVLDLERRRLEREGSEIALQPKVFETLVYLVKHAPRVIPKGELLGALWPRQLVTEGVLTRCIKELRGALDDDVRAPRYIRSTQRVGYAFVADVGAAGRAGSLRTIAVLPFEPLVARERDESLELGISDALINRLSGLRALCVRPLSAVRKYAGGNHNPLATGRELNAQVVIEGSLLRSDDRLRLTVRALRVADGVALFAASFDERFAGVFEIQDAICGRIADSLALELTTAESARLTKHLTEDPAAYTSYLLGRFHLHKHTPDGDRRSIQYFEKAVAKDSRYALAWAGLADAYESLGTVEPDQGHFAKVREYSLRALEIDPDLVPALICLGKLAWEHEWNWDAAEQHFRKALEAGPGSADAYIAYSDYCAYRERGDDAIAAAGKALEIDPSSPLVNAYLAQALHMAGLFEEAIAQADRTLAQTPDFAFAHLFRALPALMSGRHGEAIIHLQKAHASSNRIDFAGALGYAYAVAGRRNEARTLLAQLEKGGAPPIVLAFIHHGLGDDERAVDFVEAAAAQRDWHVLLLGAEPLFAKLCDHPRTAALLERIGARPARSAR